MRFLLYLKLTSKHPRFILKMDRQTSKDALYALLVEHDKKCRGCR